MNTWMRTSHRSQSSRALQGKSSRYHGAPKVRKREKRREARDDKRERERERERETATTTTAAQQERS
jgi:hypothetical protein